MKPVDAHCHLDFEQFDSDRDKVIEKSSRELEFVVNAGSNVEHNKAALKLQEENPDTVTANLGLHPVYVDSFDELEQVKEQIRENEPTAIGEIGLDRHHVTDEENREKQEKIFREMLELAEDLDLPVVVHSREAERKAFKILKEYKLPGVMLHCFNGSPKLAREIASEGMMVGVTTQVLYSDKVEEIAREIPLENILLETDSPYLLGERNEPLNVKKSAKRIAELKSVDVERVVKTTTGNAKEFFQK